MVFPNFIYRHQQKKPDKPTYRSPMNTTRRKWLFYGVAILLVFSVHIVVRIIHVGTAQPPTSAVVGPPGQLKTTLVLMGYSTKRLENYEIIFPAYAAMTDSLDKILFLWNNLEEPPPPLPASQNGQVPITVLPQKENSMNNRYGPDVTQHTSTSSVTLVDDDVLLSPDMLRALVDTWEAADGQSIVGVQGSGRILDRDMGYNIPCYRMLQDFVPLLQWACWREAFQPPALIPSRLFNKPSALPISQRTPNMVIGKTMVLQTEILKAYQNDKVLWNYLAPDQVAHHGCEDIGMNALARNITGHDPLIVPFTATRTQTEMVTKGGLSLGFTWPMQRSECARWAARRYDL